MPEASSHFSPLNVAEKRSKLRQLDQIKGQLTLWRKGEKTRLIHRVKSFNRESDELVVHLETLRPKAGELILASFDLNGVSYFFKASVARFLADEITLQCTDEFYKSERRQNVRVLTFPVFDLNGFFTIPVSYEDGKILNISRRPSQTGIFKSFLKLVDAGDAGDDSKLKLRLQDLSSTGMSVFVGPAELDWFKAGEELRDTEIHFVDEVLRFPKIKIVYVVDHIGHASRKQKQYKVGLRFDEMPQSLAESLNGKIATMLRTLDLNKDFEDFLK